MTESHHPSGASRATRSDARLWQIVAAVLALLVVTLLITTIALRSRSEAAVSAQQAADQRAAELENANRELTERNERLFTQLSTSNERLTDAVDQVDVPAQYRDVSARQLRRAAAAKGARDAQLRNAQLCSAATLKALSQIHAGADIESGSDKALTILGAAVPVCRIAFR